MVDHLTLELLRALPEDDLRPRELAALALAHLLELCPHCQHAFQQWWRETRADERNERASWRCSEPPVDGIGSSAGKGGGPLQRVAELLSLPVAERLQRVQMQPGEFSGPILAELLLREARRCLPDRLQEAGAVARLARAVVHHEDSSSETTALYARALAHEGNAARALGDVKAAEELLETARFLLVSRGRRDALAMADLDNLEGSLRRTQQRLDEARELFERAARTYAKSGLSVEQARTLISLGIVLLDLGQPDRAIEVTRHAQDLLWGTPEPRLTLCIQHNLGVFFRESGDLEGARKIMDSARELYERFADPCNQLRFRLQEAKLVQAEGDLGSAEAILREVRAGFFREKRPLDAAFAGLHLAMLLARQGRVAELEELTREIVAVFEEIEIYPEADAARKLLEEATGAGSPPVH